MENTNKTTKQIEGLKNALEVLDATVQNTCTKIQTIVDLALDHLETPKGANDTETLAQVLFTIKELLANLSADVGTDVSLYGCNSVNYRRQNRFEAKQQGRVAE